MIQGFDSVVFLLPFVATAISLVALIFAILMHLKVSKIFRSASVPDIERLLKLHTKTLEDSVRFQAESSRYMKSLDERIKRKMKSAATLRFNPFSGQGEGGNQSFSSVFADEEGDGVIITSMHTRERTNVFAKPINKWQSSYELTSEEKEALKISKTNDGNKK